MTPCSLCTTPTPQLNLTPIWLSDGSKVDVCIHCITEAVEDKVTSQRRAREAFCQECPQLSGDVCRQGVTPDTCA
jgi:hypothetical protein